MEIDEALAQVQHLASGYRLLIGRHYRRPNRGDAAADENSDARQPSEMDWQAGDIRDIRKLRGLEYTSEIGEPLMALYEKHQTGAPHAIVFAWSEVAVTFIVLGAESVEQVAETLRAGAQELVSQSVKGYLANHFSRWKRPPAKVLPFRKPDVE
ncbi:hypothetical protein G3N95_09770 [Paraburkholderia sp. Tr-20389]|uniref:hypothetical protein n=1 Tax=Paraburkholderia sp. Tr-20389 TaxID=2703903 RepID=UPI00197FBEE4|nr:hypothetical protein [Paraburkholderia sp. Tr-20389]MBN3753232.1 hypothetical protein [Paraburkholderia sp. Tr-20389]